tara:strand:+ start:320 stop:547 length:228 start_codon:yes stop_codon:yes gene_type:complete
MTVPKTVGLPLADAPVSGLTSFEMQLLPNEDDLVLSTPTSNVLENVSFSCTSTAMAFLPENGLFTSFILLYILNI